MNYIFIGIIGFILVVVVIMFNMLIVKKNQVNNIFATVDVLLKKRYDLIPNLVSTVKGYATHEASVFKEIAELRAKAVSGQVSDDEKVELSGKVSGALKSIFAVAENYPELKASENFIQLQRTLNELEEQISAARRAFNASVNDYNNSVQMFPTNILASIMGFQIRTYFSAGEEDRANVNTGELFRK